MNCRKTSLAVALVALTFSGMIPAWALAGKDKTPPPPPLRYTITYLKPLEGTDWATCTDMNDSGQIVGWCGYNTDNARRYFLFVPNGDFSDGEMIDLDTLLPSDPSGYSYYARGVCAINNRGQIAGEAYEYYLGNPSRRMAFRLSPPEVSGHPWKVELLPWVSDMKAMNEDGDIVGGVHSVVVWPAGTNQFVDLGTLYGSGEGARGNLISGRDANGCVLVAGEVGFQAGTFLFRYRIGGDPCSPDDLQKCLMPGIRDAAMTGSFGMNALGHITGEAYVRGRWVWHAIIYRPETDTLTDLGTLGGEDSIARDINDLGDVVGQSDTKKSTSAFLVTEGAMWDLASLIDPDENGELPYSMFGGHYVVYAKYCINNLRMICGPSSNYGLSTNDTPKAFLLVPYKP